MNLLTTSSALRSKKFLRLGSGFTMVELLVVMSVISLLSSTVLAAAQGARDKARVSAATSFSSNMFHALGSDAEMNYGFTEGAGTSVKDFFIKHPGTITDPTNPVTASDMWDNSSTPAGSGYSLKFNGTNELVTLTNTFVVPATFTIAAWVKIAAAPAVMAPIFTNQVTTGKTAFAIDSVGHVWGSSTSNGVNNQNTFSIQTVTDNKWHYIVWTSDGNNSTMYIDGKKDSTAARVTLATSDPVAYIGFFPGGYYFNGNIDDVAIYTQNIAAADIGHMYAAGAATHSGEVALR